jgi:UDP-galactopyranose mutase
MSFDVLIVGCGLSGVVMAERFAREKNKKVLILEKREHIGGNVYDYIDEETNILMNKYGAHLFHTNNQRVWDYVNRFDNWIRWDHKVLGKIDEKLVPIPININSVNALSNKNITNSTEMDEYLQTIQVKYDTIENSEEMAKSRVGEELYEKVFKNYTFKQWEKYPSELDSSVLARIPIRNNFDNRYFSDRYQALPEKGYTHFIQNIIYHPNITVKLNTNYFEFLKNFEDSDKIVIYTGPIDEFFKNSESNLEPLEYRSIDFIIEKYKDIPFYQTNSVINYPGLETPYTRIVEYKHFLNQVSNHTVIVKEITKECGEPYYPIPNKKNMERYEKYKELAYLEKNTHFLGRLANYKYFNMDEAILNSLEYFDHHFL